MEIYMYVCNFYYMDSWRFIIIHLSPRFAELRAHHAHTDQTTHSATRALGHAWMIDLWHIRVVYARVYVYTIICCMLYVFFFIKSVHAAALTLLYRARSASVCVAIQVGFYFGVNPGAYVWHAMHLSTRWYFFFVCVWWCAVAFWHQYGCQNARRRGACARIRSI